jgi:glycosyltransferase involved in cell wall biosynthesis
MRMSNNAAAAVGSAPLVSICIPTYNSGATLAKTLASISAQTYTHLEILVVDNVSTDNTLEVARRFDDPRIRIYENVENIGAEGNFNRCIQLANGEYTAIYHADDLYLEQMVAEQVRFLARHPTAGGVLTEAMLIDGNGRQAGAISLPPELNRTDSACISFTELFSALLRHSNFLICPSAMVRTTVYQNVIKCWRGDLFGSSADLDIWIRIARHSRLGLLPAKLMQYRISTAQFSSKVRDQTGRADFFRVMDHYLLQEDVRAAMTPHDLENYRRLVRRDTVMRAANLFLMDQFTQAASQMKGFFSTEMLAAAISNKRSCIVLLLGLYLKIANVPGLRKYGQTPLGKLKRVMRK